MSKSEHADRFREVTVDDNGGYVNIEEYPGGDMSIYTRRSELYLTSDEAAALRSALGKIDADKQPLDTESDQDD